MIREISICRCASCGDTAQVLSPLGTCNYLFGFNGSGKSTIARLIANPTHPDFADSSIKWCDDHPVDVLVYNREFIKENFDDADDLRGVFTLGKGSKEAKVKTAEKKREAAGFTSEIGSLQDALTKAESQLAQTEATTAEACWKTVDPRKSVFREAFAGGHLASQDAFMQELLRHRADDAELQTLPWLQDRARVVLDSSPEPLSPFPVLDTKMLRGCEDAPLLETRIVASGDVPIAALIDKMGNSDWLRDGQNFLEHSEGMCPFCQQVLPEDLEQQMAAIFNEEFLRLTSEYETFVEGYKQAVQDVLDTCERILDGENEYLDAQAFQAKRNALRAESVINVGRLEAKLKEPSTVVDLVSLKDILTATESLISSANGKIEDHNKMVADAANQKILLTGQIWLYLADSQLKPLLDKYAAVSERQLCRFARFGGSSKTRRTSVTALKTRSRCWKDRSRTSAGC